ncbi:unnamed protein product [Rotaria sordida]|uniref:PDZ domain-containing protein n=1 Tax=Rotaria sordida TaxID=392033 RepID=A0A813Y8W3_9BILA|nr:unnamed protein product [Rotaria sordida]
MCWWLYFMIMSFDLIRTQSPISGGGFLADPFLELTAGVTTPAISKSNKSDPSCLSNGALAGSIIGTLIMSMFIGFLTWLIYLRPKFKELHYIHLQEKRRITNKQQHHHVMPSSSNSNYKQQTRRQQTDDDRNDPQLPLDVTDHKFGTFPFRQSQGSSKNGHYNGIDWLNRISSSFRSVNMDRDFEMIDIALLDPTFSGLNFSITGNMRAGIFVKDIIDKGISQESIKTNSSDQLKTGDRIMALTVCFESIVYEDALTILSYASPYPVILRVQRPLSHTKVNETPEKRPTTANTTSRVKWRDDFEHYDNDTSLNHSFVQPNPPIPTNCLPPVPINPKVPSPPKKSSSSKKLRPHASTQSRINNKSSSSTNKGNKIKTSSNSVLATSGATTKRCNNDIKKYRSKTNNNSNNNNNNQRTVTNQMMVMSTGLTAKPSTNITTSPIPINVKTIRSVTESVMSYLHYKGGTGEEEVEHTKDRPNHSERTMTPYYDSPYDYYYGGQGSQYQYLHQSHLNKNNNNSVSTESLTAVTPNVIRSVYTIQLLSTKSCPPIRRRCERRLSSPVIITSAASDDTIINVNEHENSIDDIDTFV